MSSRPRSSLSAISHLNIEVTRQCNQQCWYCFNDSGPWVPKTKRTVNEWVLLCCKLRESGLKSVHVTGGEPFVWPHTISLLNQLQSEGFGTSVLTNGFRLPTLTKSAPAVFRKLTVVQLSLDSMDPKTHDERRGVAGAWQQAVDAIEALRALEVPVEISCTVSEPNHDALTAIAAYCATVNAQLILRPLYLAGRASGALLPATFALELDDELAVLRRSFPKLVTEDRFDYVPSSIRRIATDQLSRSMTVDPDGKISARPCGGHLATDDSNLFQRLDAARVTSPRDVEVQVQ